ncbi:hypothetical protein GCM10009133_28080 [Cocleimonas flava]|uniref:Uncharacterized protein DUF4340 n=1 Tax=Cocleimonas flava TaxID=634765 RepID=A0A4R1FBJ8_9GAMM|nr:DUF4340 domain-containing protein [Cocleimonas flava]TCJ89348.1 uncharacterized protein DUF4340 [Cocleimonas flava]
MLSPNSKRLVQNFILLIVVAALAAFIILREDEKELYTTLYDTSIGDEATDIVIHVEGQEDVVLKNTEGKWKVTKPEQFDADEEKVRHLFTLLSENADTHYDIADKNLADFGLDKDYLSVSFNGVKLVFGDYNEVAQKRYVLKGDKMYLISETVSGLLESGASSFKPLEMK